MAPTFSAQINPKDIARVKKNLQRFQGAPLAMRAGKGTLAAARLLVGPIRGIAPVLSGGTRSSVRARATRAGGGFIAGAKVGPTTRIGPPLIRGHVLIAWGNETGMTVPANPFVDEAVEAHRSEAIRLVSEELFKP